MKNILNFNKFNESDETTIITISKGGTDERSERTKTFYDVNYLTKSDGDVIEITGTLNPLNTGRSGEYEFEPSEFNSEREEEYYDSNWEDIEEEIQKELTNFLSK